MIGFQKKFSPLEQTLTASSKKYSWSGTWIKWQRGVVVRRSFQYQRHNGTDDERHEHVINRHSDVIWVIQGRYSDIACLPNHKIPNNCNDPWYVKACKHDRKKKRHALYLQVHWYNAWMITRWGLFIRNLTATLGKRPKETRAYVQTWLTSINWYG